MSKDRLLLFFALNRLKIYLVQNSFGAVVLGTYASHITMPFWNLDCALNFCFLLMHTSESSSDG